MNNDRYNNIEYFNDSYLIDMLINMNKRNAGNNVIDSSVHDAYMALENADMNANELFMIMDELQHNRVSRNKVETEFNSTIKFSQLKRIDIPGNITNIKDGLAADIVSQLQQKLKYTTGVYERSKKVKHVNFATNADDISRLLSDTGIARIIKIFTKSNVFEFGESDAAEAYFSTLALANDTNISKNLLKDNISLSVDISIKEFTIDYDINTKDFDVISFNKNIESIKKENFNITDNNKDIDTPIYVDIYTNSIYFLQNITLSFASSNSISKELESINTYLSLVSNLLQILHNNIKYKLDNKFAYTKRQSDILKLLSDVSNIGVYTVYDSVEDAVNLQFSPNDAFGLSINIEDKND